MATRTRRTFAAAAGTLLAVSLAGAPAATAEPVTPLASTTCNVGAQTWAVTGNWDGIGGDGIGIVTVTSSGLLWRLRNAPNAGPADYTFTYGGLFDRPVVGNWDGVGGDGPGYLTIDQTSSGPIWHWHLSDGADAVTRYDYPYGRATYTPVVGNWDGVGGDGPGVVGGNADGYLAWHLRDFNYAGDPHYNFPYGLTSDRPISGNWDGVGGDGPGINRGAQNQPLQWHERLTLTGGPADYAFTYGDVNTDCAVATNADGIGGDGPGVVRYNGNRVEWHLRNGNNTGQDDFTFVFPS